MTLKRILILAFLSFITFFVNAQTGLNFQGVARTSNNTILASQPISLRLSILQGSANGTVEYVEVRKVNTNAQGLFSVVIGDEEATNTIGSISSINWKNTPKFLKIEMDATAGNNFTIVGTTQFQYVAYAQFAKSVDAENIAGIIPVEKGGTGVASINALKNVLDLGSKANLIDLNTGLDNKVDKVAGKTLSTNDFTTIEKNKLASITGTNTGDQDLSSYATISSMALKANTTDLINGLSLKANISDVNANLALKENTTNKSTATDLGGLNPSDILYPTQKAVKAYVTANNSSGGIADGGITTNKLADAAVNFQKFQSIPSNTILGNTNSSTTSIQAINTTGVNNVVLSSNPIIQSPTLITPTLGHATATTINNVTINALNGNASLTVRGDVTLRGMNNGDDAPNQRYENILTDIVSLTANQPIDGQKTFQNNIVMGNIGGISNTSSPTTIQFSNGSKIGDIQNINEGVPDTRGSIDLYAPDGAKWVQLNYNNTNYIGIDRQDGIFLEYYGLKWEFGKEYGMTKIPGSLSLDGLGYNASINSSADLEINTDRNLTLKSNNNSSLIKFHNELITFEFPFENYVWYFYGDEGGTRFPGELDLERGDIKLYDGDLFFNHDNHSIEFLSNGRDLNTKMYSSGPYFKIETRDANFNEKNDEDILKGIELSYLNNSKLGIKDGEISNIVFNSTEQNSNGASFTSLTKTNFNFWLSNSTAEVQNRWQFDGETAKTSLPGNLEIAGDLKLGDVLYSNEGGASGDVLTYDGNGHAIWQAPITGTGTNGQISFFNSTKNITSSSNLFWDDNKNSFTIGDITSNVINKFITVSGGTNNNSLLIAAPSGAGAGAQIGFTSDYGNNGGLFQLDGAGNMVFRSNQGKMSFDNIGDIMQFRIAQSVSDLEYNSKKMVLNTHGDLSVDGDITTPGSITAQNFNTSSDFRLKKYIKPLENSLSILKQLNPVAYQKKLSLESNDYPIKENGFIAQELEKVLPNLVHASEDKDHLLSVNYTAIIPILTKGIQEQQQEIEILKKELQELKKLIQTKHKLK